MPRRLLESFGSFPESSWFQAFAEDVREARRVRIASGFMDQRGARDLVECLPGEAHTEILLGLLGCSGPEVVDELQKCAGVVVRASRVIDFHWKVACIEGERAPVVFVGSANFTRKGMSGRGETMLRITGSALASGCWDQMVSDFDDYFSEHKTRSADAAKALLASMEAMGDQARRMLADFQVAFESVLAKANTDALAPDQRIWLVVWNADLTPREAALAARVMGPSPPDSTWTRGEVQGEEGRVKRVNPSDIVLGYSRDATWFVLGRVGKLCSVNMAPDDERQVADLEHLSRRLVRVRLSGDDDSAEDPAAYDALRATIRGQEDGELLSAAVSRTLWAHLKQSGLLLS
jgi:hypothetical protein